MTPRLRLLAAATLCLGSAAWAGNPPEPDPCLGRSQASCQAPGWVGPPVITVRKGALDKAEAQQVTSRVTKMLEVVLRAPRLHQPRGMSLSSDILVEAPPPHAVKHHPALVRASVLARDIVLENKRSVQDKKTGTWKGTGEGPALRLHLNDLGVFLSNDTLDLSKPAQFFSEPRQVGEVQGFPVFSVGNNEVLLISKRDTVPWRPFSVESYFQMLIAQEQETQAVFQKQRASATATERPELDKVLAERQATIDALKGELAQLSPEQRQAGACLSARRKRNNPTGLDLTCAPKSDPLVVVNQDVFTREAPKGSLQFLAITTTWGVIPKDDRMPNILGQILRTSLQDMDLEALQAMLD